MGASQLQKKLIFGIYLSFIVTSIPITDPQLYIRSTMPPIFDSPRCLFYFKSHI